MTEKKPARKRKPRTGRVKRRVLVLMHETLVPPESIEGVPDKELAT